jgi:hypothetical protein
MWHKHMPTFEAINSGKNPAHKSATFSKGCILQIVDETLKAFECVAP